MQTDKSSLKCFIGILREQGFRITPIVSAVLSQLFDSRQVKTIPQIREEISRTLGYNVSNPTAYRICERLRQAGLLRSMHSTDSIMRYYICGNPGDKEHLHFICTRCMKVQKVDVRIEDKITKYIKTKLRAEVQSNFVQIEGFCETCRS